MLTKNCLAGMNMNFRFHTFDAFLTAVENAGLTKVEIWGGYPHLYLPYSGMDDIKALRDKVYERGMDIVCYTPEQCVYPINIADARETVRKESLAYFCRAVDVAAALGTENLLVSSGWGMAEDDLSQSHRYAKESLCQLCAYASGKGITLLMEVLQRKESNLVFNLDLLKEYVAEIDHPNFQVMVDTVSMAAAGDTLEAYFDAFGERLRHIHFVDGTPSGHIVWGEGNLPMAHYLRVLEKRGYAHALSFELAGYELHPADAMLRCAEACRVALNNLHKEPQT